MPSLLLTPSGPLQPPTGPGSIYPGANFTKDTTHPSVDGTVLCWQGEDVRQGYQHPERGRSVRLPGAPPGRCILRRPWKTNIRICMSLVAI